MAVFCGIIDVYIFVLYPVFTVVLAIVLSLALEKWPRLLDFGSATGGIPPLRRCAP